MSVLRRALLAWAIALPIWAMLIGLTFSTRSLVPPVWAQDQLPTTPSGPPTLGVGHGQPPVEAPTKPPLEPQPTKEQILPTGIPATKGSPATEVPTKASTNAPTKIPSPVVSGTPWPTVLPTKIPSPVVSGTAVPTGLPTKLALPTQLPTTPNVGDGWLPLPTATVAQSSPTPGETWAENSTPVVDRGARPAEPSAPANTQPLLATATITGIVFDDANDNGERDLDEVGLPGVAVSVAPGGPPPDGGHGQSPAETYIAVTDARGVYVLPMVAGATVRVIVPAGWSTRQSESLPLDRAGDFPLRAKNSVDTRQPAAITPLTITQSVIDFAPLIALGLGLGVVMAIGFLRLARAVSTSNQALALLLVRMQRTSEKPITFDGAGPDRATDARALAVLNQAGLDAAGRSLNIERVLSVTAGDHPAIIALGQDGRAAFVIFTPLNAKLFQRVWRAGCESSASEVTFEHATAYPLDRLGEALTSGESRPLDALNSGLFVTDDLAAVYAYLAAELPVSARTLPRTSRWTLFVAPLPRSDLAIHSSWRYRIGRKLRS